MEYSSLTKQQKAVLRYRTWGLTQGRIATLANTSKSNICRLEKTAQEKIRRAKNTLLFYYSLDARPLCTLKAGSDLFDAVSLIFGEAGKLSLQVTVDPVDLITRLRDENPKCIHDRHIREDIVVFLRDDGGLYFW